MNPLRVQAWRCDLCGYIHEGPEPPVECPVCGAPASDFSPVREASAPAAPPATAAGVRRIVIMGGGIAAVSAAEGARQTSAEAEITLVSAERELPYYRLNLTRLLAGEIPEDALPLHPAAWYEQQRIRLRTGTEAVGFSPDRREVEIAGGEKVAFDRLVVATGARAFVPPWPGRDRPGVFAIRTADDVRRVVARLARGLRCVCVGGGLLGLETAGALAKRGVRVELLETAGWLMVRQLTRAAGEVLARHVEELGVRLRPMSEVREITGSDHATGVRMEDGAVLPADLVLVATGIRCASTVAAAAGLTVNRGVIVDDFLATSHPGVLAAGDVAEHRGQVYGLWPAAQYQGILAGMNAAGQPAAFAGIPRSSVLKVLGVHVFSVGRFEAEAGDTVIESPAGDGYERYVFREGRLMGANLVGRAGLDAALKKAVEEGRDFSDLLARKPTPADVAEGLRGG